MTRISLTILLAGFSGLALASCEGSSEPQKSAKTEAKPAVKTPPPPSAKADAKADANKPVEPKESPEDKAKTAATVANEIAGNPADADAILAKHDMDREKLDALMYEIARDPELTKAYAQARTVDEKAH